MLHFARIFAVGLLCALPAHANDSTYPPAGITEVTLNTFASREVAPDRMRLELLGTVEENTAVAAQNQLNMQMQKALAEVKKNAELKINTGSYRVYEYRRERHLPARYRAEQQLNVEGEDQAELLALAGTLQGMGMQLQGTQHFVSPQLHASIGRELLTEGLAHLDELAQTVANQQNKTSVRAIRIQPGSIHMPQPNRAMHRMQTAELAASAMAAPISESSEQAVTLHINGTYWLE